MRVSHALLVAGLCVGSFAVVGCGSKADRQQPIIQAGVELPNWVADPFLDSNFGAVGISRKSLGGMQEQVDRAMAAGRTELGRTVSTKVQAAYTRFFTEGGETVWGADGQPEMQTMAQEMSENVSRQLTDQLLRGSRRKQIWIHPKNEDVYVWVIIDPALMDTLNQQVQQQAREELRRSQVRAELKAADALKRLDAAIDNEIRRQSGEAPPAPAPAAQ